MDNLIGHTSGFAVPTYVVDAPGGGGKIPLTPNYLLSLSTNKVLLRNYEGVITTYHEPESYKAIFCDRKCDDCKLDLKLEGAEECEAWGTFLLGAGRGRWEVVKVIESCGGIRASYPNLRKRGRIYFSTAKDLITDQAGRTAERT